MSKDAEPSDDDGYEAGYQAAKIVPQEFVQDALDFSCGYFDCLRERSISDGLGGEPLDAAIAKIKEAGIHAESASDRWTPSSGEYNYFQGQAQAYRMAISYIEAIKASQEPKHRSLTDSDTDIA